MQRKGGAPVAPTQSAAARAPPRRERSAPPILSNAGETPAQDPLSQVVPGKEDMGDDYDAIVVQMAQLVEHSDPAQQPPWDGSGLPETAAEMQELG